MLSLDPTYPYVCIHLGSQFPISDISYKPKTDLKLLNYNPAAQLELPPINLDPVVLPFESSTTLFIGNLQSLVSGPITIVTSFEQLHPNLAYQTDFSDDDMRRLYLLSHCYDRVMIVNPLTDSTNFYILASDLRSEYQHILTALTTLNVQLPPDFVQWITTIHTIAQNQDRSTPLAPINTYRLSQLYNT